MIPPYAKRKARRSKYRGIADYTAAMGIELMPWQVAFLVTSLAGPGPRNHRYAIAAARKNGKKSGARVILAIHDELRKDSNA